ncbi:MAG: tandem-95 repeat protein [Thermoplasmatota archaeon]
MRHRSNLSLAIVMMLALSGAVILAGDEAAKPENRVIDRDTTFSIAVFPDTQIYPMYYPGTFINMTQWVAEHRDEYNIKFVLHEGDITNNNNHPQWRNASKAMYVLNGSVPYTLNPGNHDLGPNGYTANRDTYLNDYFPSEPIENWTSWGGAFEKGHQENTYHFFSAGGRDWMVVALEFAPRDAVLDWANDIVEANPDRFVLVVTHNYMVADQRMTTLGGNYGVANSPDGANNGEEIWQKFVRNHRNIMCVFSGHILYEWGWLVSKGINGNPVYQMMANFQMNSRGGEGFFRLLTFDMDAETVYVETYSSLLDELRTEGEHQFSFDFNTFDHVNDPPVILNFMMEYEMHEDQDAGYIDLDGNERPSSGIFYDPNIEQGDRLEYYVFDGLEYKKVSKGSPLEYREALISLMDNGTFAVSFAKNWHGSRQLLIESRDTRGGAIGTMVEVKVSSVNDPPVLLEPGEWTYEEPVPEVKGDIMTCKEDALLGFKVNAYDVIEPDDVLRYSMSTPGSGEYSLHSETGAFSFRPGNDDVGDHLITFTVSDGTDTASRDVLIRVVNTNDAPVISTSMLPTAYEDADWWFIIRAKDADPTEDRLTWSLMTDARFLEIDSRTGNLSGTPLQEHAGSHHMVVKVEDGNGGEDSVGLVLEVFNTNDPPHIAWSPSTFFMDEDTTAYFDISGWFADIDGDELSFSVMAPPEVRAEANDNKTILIEPTKDWAGQCTILVNASDGEERISDTLKIVVDNINDPPTDPGYRIESEDLTGNGKMFRLIGWASDPDIDDRLTVDWFSNITGKLGSGAEVEFLLQPGHHLITMKVTDRAGDWAQLNFELLVPPLNGTSDQYDDDGDASDKEGSSGTTLVIVIVVSIVLILIAALAAALVLMRRKGSEEDPRQEETNPPGDNHPGI